LNDLHEDDLHQQPINAYNTLAIWL
jgi:hypothetical protein